MTKRLRSNEVIFNDKLRKWLVDSIWRLVVAVNSWIVKSILSANRGDAIMKKTNRLKTCDTSTNHWVLNTSKKFLLYKQKYKHFECDTRVLPFIMNINESFAYCLLHSELRLLHATIFIFLHKFKLKYGVCFVNKYYGGRHSLSNLNDMIVSVMVVKHNFQYTHEKQKTKNQRK